MNSELCWIGCDCSTCLNIGGGLVLDGAGRTNATPATKRQLEALTEQRRRRAAKLRQLETARATILTRKRVAHGRFAT